MHPDFEPVFEQLRVLMHKHFVDEFVVRAIPNEELGIRMLASFDFEADKPAVEGKPAGIDSGAVTASASTRSGDPDEKAVGPCGYPNCTDPLCALQASGGEATGG